MLACQKRPRERGFDAEMSSPMEPSCSPNRMLVFESPTSKRTRMMGQQSVAAEEERGGTSSPFQSFASADAAGNAAAEDAAMRHHREGSPSPRSGADGAMFSLDQVRDIVTRTVEARERVLRQEYDRVLQQKLQEQWASFAKFNEDYVSRTLKSSDLSYLS